MTFLNAKCMYICHAFKLKIEIKLIFQVWFQNRRAKFRRNERSVFTSRPCSITQNSNTGAPYRPSDIEQPLAPRPSAGIFPYSANNFYQKLG